MTRSQSSRNPAGRADPSPRPPASDAARALAARRAAASTLRHVLEKRAQFDEALAQAEARAGGLEPRERQLARSIALIALKHLGALRRALDARLRKPLSDSPPDFAAALLAAATQILFMAIPAHAAVDTAVTLIRDDRRLAGLAGVANAVLRGIVADKEAILAAHDPIANWPAWLTERWSSIYGKDRARRIAVAMTLEPTLDLTILKDAERWAAALDGVRLPTGSIRLQRLDAIETLPGYGDGAWLVQDAASAMPARLLGAKPGERVLDLCAAPGGKTAQLAAAGAFVTAIDRSPARLKRLRENLARLGLSAEIIAADASEWSGDPGDAILLDAPCSSTGTIRRHPDVAWTKTPDDLLALAALQTRLLDRAADLLKPGGRLVYSTCSLEPEEGERQIESLLARRPDLARAPITSAETPGLEEAIDRDGALRVTPDFWPSDQPRLAGLDGFYAARLRRVG